MNLLNLIWQIDAECGDKETVRQLRESKCSTQVSQMFDF